jgi:hypothetical protein
MTDSFGVRVRDRNPHVRNCPSFANGIVDHDEGAAWCQRVAGEVEGSPMNSVVCGDCRLICIGLHHVESEFSLRYKFVPKVNGER